TPLDDVNGAWDSCNPSSSAKFSAVAYFFGRKLHQELGIPIGLINTSWGGTRAEAWTSRAGLEAEPALKEVVAELDAPAGESREDVLARYAKLRVAWFKQLPQDTENR